jgi:hypothetical protein
MNSQTGKVLSGTGVRFRLPYSLAFGPLVLWCVTWLIADEPHTSPDLTVHEWGTFTAVAGKHGNAVAWTPLPGSTDLPGFVEHFSDANFKTGLRGTIRMETPVLYFYSARDTTVSVKVTFSRGIISEWYPHAVRVQPNGVLRNTNLSQLHNDGSIEWRGVTLSPNLSGEFPREDRANRYYAARDTSSTPLCVKTTAGDQQEKFLFYRGVSAALLPVTARQSADGNLLVKNLDENDIPAIILFERRGERAGYRFVRSFSDETVLEPPSLTGSMDAPSGDLEGLLVDQGLFPDEAHAMLETWRDSWFEEGSRLIYIVPREFVDKILPLTIDPAPSQTVRVFVGRLEIATSATERAVETALATHDEVALSKYGRFLEPILQGLREEHHGSAHDISSRQ